VSKKVSRPFYDQVFSTKINKSKKTQNHRTAIFRYSNNLKVSPRADLCTFRFHISFSYFSKHDKPSWRHDRRRQSLWRPCPDMRNASWCGIVVVIYRTRSFVAKSSDALFPHLREVWSDYNDVASYAPWQPIQPQRERIMHQRILKKKEQQSTRA
jgi:hypothetical protein